MESNVYEDKLIEADLSFFRDSLSLDLTNKSQDSFFIDTNKTTIISPDGRLCKVAQCDRGRNPSLIPGFKFLGYLTFESFLPGRPGEAERALLKGKTFQLKMYLQGTKSAYPYSFKFRIVDVSRSPGNELSIFIDALFLLITLSLSIIVFIIVDRLVNRRKKEKILKN
jgi:hypothetical protein